MLNVAPFNKLSVGHQNGQIVITGHNVATITTSSFKAGEEYTYPSKIMALDLEDAVEFAQSILDECGKIDGSG